MTTWIFMALTSWKTERSNFLEAPEKHLHEVDIEATYPRDRIYLPFNSGLRAENLNILVDWELAYKNSRGRLLMYYWLFVVRTYFVSYTLRLPGLRALYYSCSVGSSHFGARISGYAPELYSASRKTRQEFQRAENEDCKLPLLRSFAKKCVLLVELVLVLLLGTSCYSNDRVNTESNWIWTKHRVGYRDLGWGRV